MKPFCNKIQWITEQLRTWDLHAKDIQGKSMTGLHPLMQIQCKDIQHMKRPSDLQGI